MRLFYYITNRVEYTKYLSLNWNKTYNWKQLKNQNLNMFFCKCYVAKTSSPVMYCLKGIRKNNILKPL